MDVQFDLFKGDLDELFEVVRTVLVDTSFESYRLEVLRNCYPSDLPYKVRCWRLEDLNWVKYDLPWVAAPNATDALHVGLSRLKERVRK